MTCRYGRSRLPEAGSRRDFRIRHSRGSGNPRVVQDVGQRGSGRLLWQAPDRDDVVGDGAGFPVRAGGLALGSAYEFGLPEAGIELELGQLLVGAGEPGVPMGPEPGGTEAWVTMSRRPPGAAARAAACRTRSRGNSTGDCRYWAETRSKVPAGKVWARSCCWKSMWSSTPASAAYIDARSRAVADTSTAVTRQPRPASQTASPPSPQPRSNAVPGGGDPAMSTSMGFAFPLHTRSCFR